jgi:hypothetical protein
VRLKAHVPFSVGQAHAPVEQTLRRQERALTRLQQSLLEVQ